MENKDDGSVSLFDVKMENRAAIWVSHPNAKEISKKKYIELRKYFDSDEYRQQLIKYNK
jgi:hypothetical protein